MAKYTAPESVPEAIGNQYLRWAVLAFLGWLLLLMWALPAASGDFSPLQAKVIHRIGQGWVTLITGGSAALLFISIFADRAQILAGAALSLSGLVVGFPMAMEGRYHSAAFWIVACGLMGVAVAIHGAVARR